MCPVASPQSLAGRVAVVTGGESGIGAGVTSALRSLGVHTVTWDIAGGPDVRCDVGDDKAVAAAMEWTCDSVGVPTLLVASAGIYAGTLIVDLDVDVWDRIQRVNTRGVFLSVRAVAQRLIDAGLGGAIVIIGSVNGVVADPTTSAYAASKAASMHFARVAARELGRHHIRVNVVAPGPTNTAMMNDAYHLPGYLDGIAANTPLGRVGTVDDISEAVIAMLQLRWVTGQSLVVDGGAGLATARGAAIAARTEHQYALARHDLPPNASRAGPPSTAPGASR